MDFKSGDIYSLCYGHGHFGNKRIHIRAIVDEEMVVFRWWRKRKQYWQYEVEGLYWFRLRKDHLTKVKGGRG